MRNKLKETILVTDTLFIGPAHERHLVDAGYDVERLASPCATEEELTRALAGKVGYILGGTEHVSAELLSRCDKLKAIAFTGSDYRAFITGHEVARSRGIAISNCPGANSDAVAELAIAGFLMLSRGILDLGRLDKEKFSTMKSLSDYRLGIVGMGPLARSIASKLIGLGARGISYENRTRYPEYEREFGLRYRSLSELFSECNGIFIATATARGVGFINSSILEKLTPGSIVSNCSFEGAIDPTACLQALREGRCKIFQDSKPGMPEFEDIAPSNLYWTNHAGFNTESSIEKVSTMATQSVINLLQTGSDRYRAV